MKTTRRIKQFMASAYLRFVSQGMIRKKWEWSSGLQVENFSADLHNDVRNAATDFGQEQN